MERSPPFFRTVYPNRNHVTTHPAIAILYKTYLFACFSLCILGLDIPKHGEAAYPAEAYGHGWGEKGDSLAGLVKQAVRSTSVLANKGNDILLQC